MPIAIDPNTRIPVVLESDKDKPNPPTFYVRPLTVRETRLADTIDDRVREAAKDPEADPYAPLLEGIRMGLVGWSNVTDLQGKPISFDIGKLEDVLATSECFELMRNINSAAMLAKEDKKKSESQPLSSTDSSASNAQPENVSTAPASANP